MYLNGAWAEKSQVLAREKPERRVRGAKSESKLWVESVGKDESRGPRSSLD